MHDHILARLSSDQQRRAEDLVRRIETASAVETARRQLGLSVGKLHSRSTRASATG